YGRLQGLWSGRIGVGKENHPIRSHVEGNRAGMLFTYDHPGTLAQGVSDAEFVKHIRVGTADVDKDEVTVEDPLEHLRMNVPAVLFIRACGGYPCPLESRADDTLIVAAHVLSERHHHERSSEVRAAPDAGLSRVQLVCHRATPGIGGFGGYQQLQFVPTKTG